jgi:hypothetical protein
VRAGGRLIVTTDISRFYPSIYTHSVPWALHGKSVAKLQRGTVLAGNRLDRALRNCRDGQTVGIPVGPDTSLLIAELILSQVDRSLHTKCPSLDAMRYVDDYEFAVDSHDHGENVIGSLQELLSDFELELNPKKTVVRELPVPFDYPWASELRTLPLRSHPNGQATDLIRIFDKAFEYTLQYPDQPVLRYVLGRLKRFRAHQRNWQLYQDLLLQCMTVESGTIFAGLSHILDHFHGGFRVRRDVIEPALNRLIVRHCTFGHGNEIAWALWGLMTLRFQIASATVSMLGKITDPTVVLLTLHASRLHLCQGPLDLTLWTSLMTPDQLYGEHWLLAYEALVRGWLPSANGRDYVKADPLFKNLASLGIKFYKERAVRRVRPTGIPPSVGLAPLFYTD